MFYHNNIDACVFATNDVIPCRNLSRPQDNHTYLPGSKPELNLAREQSWSWHFIWDAFERPREGEVADVMRHTRNHYHYLIRKFKKNGDLAVRRSLRNAVMRDPSRDYWTAVKKIHKNKSLIQNRVDDKTGSVEQYIILYSCVSSEHTCLSELLMCIKTYERNICQLNYFCIQHCLFVNSTQIFGVIKRLRFCKSDGIDNLYSDNFKHGTGHVFHWISAVINCILCHGYAVHPQIFFA